MARCVSMVRRPTVCSSCPHHHSQNMYGGYHGYLTRWSYNSGFREVNDRYYVAVWLQVASGFDRYGHTKSDSESDRKYRNFWCGSFVPCSCTESHFCNFTHMKKLKCMLCITLSPHILSNALSHLPHRHLCYLLGAVMASFLVAEKTSNKLRHRTILQWTMYTMIPSLNLFRFAWRIKVANMADIMCSARNPHLLFTLAVYIAVLHGH